MSDRALMLGQDSPRNGTLSLLQSRPPFSDIYETDRDQWGYGGLKVAVLGNGRSSQLGPGLQRTRPGGQEFATQPEMSAERYRILLDSTPDSLYSLDLEYRYTAANRAACAALGLKEEKVVGRNLRDVGLPEDTLRGTIELLDRVRSGEAVEESNSFAMPDGSLRCYQVHLSPQVLSVRPSGRRD